MADILSTSYINDAISTFQSNESLKLINPLSTRKAKYQDLSSNYASLISALDSLKSSLSDFKITGSSTIFSVKAASSSNTNFLTAAADSSASYGVYDFRINQLAKNDTAVSKDLNSSALQGLSGTYSFIIKTGDGSTGEFASSVDVTLDGTESNKQLMQKIKDAINGDKAVVSSGYFDSSSSYEGGAGSFKINLNGTETVINLNGGGTYEELINEAVEQISGNIPGITAEKEIDSDTGNVRLKLTVNDSNDFITISDEAGSTIAADLGIITSNEKGASGIVSASLFSPDSATSQLSIASKNTGLDFRIKELSDSGSSGILNAAGLNLGASRPSFDQSQSPDSAGYIYSDISENNLLNTKFSFNGLNFQRNNTVISDLVEGVTFNLKAVMLPADSSVNVTVSNDTKSIRSSIESFIKKFNDAYTYIKSRSTTVSGERGIFIGDQNASSLMSSLKTIAYTKIEGLPDNALNLLSSIGISFDPSSGLTIKDSSLLDKKLSENINQVESLFNSENGIANKLNDLISPYLGSDGYLTRRQSTFDSNINDIDDRISSIQTRIDKSAEVLRNRYEQLQTQLATLMDFQNSFTSQSLDSYF
ncbi:MAG TPA: flagellar filament capping protein FliD [Ignavibacteriaceae bacterium]|nr:flagellar filament capping protein FliD [Ignavibacteriaceae bacterium]